jgi:hypothetical protein
VDARRRDHGPDHPRDARWADRRQLSVTVGAERSRERISAVMDAVARDAER